MINLPGGSLALVVAPLAVVVVSAEPPARPNLDFSQ